MSVNLSGGGSNQGALVDKLPKTDDEWDRMLAQGGLPGPEADAMWASIQGRIGGRPSWRERLSRIWFYLPVPVAAAAAALFFLRGPGPTDGYVARGTDAVRLEASCGAAGNACRVGEPIFLRMLHPTGGTLYVALRGSDGTSSMVAGPEPLTGGTTVLPVKVVPDGTDVTSGITLQWWVRAAAVEAGAVDALRQSTPDGTLHLDVVAP